MVTQKHKPEHIKIIWRIRKIGPAYSNTTKQYNLDLKDEIVIITFSEQDKLLNNRLEIICEYRHENEFFLHSLHHNQKD